MFNYACHIHMCEHVLVHALTYVLNISTPPPRRGKNGLGCWGGGSSFQRSYPSLTSNFNSISNNLNMN